MVFSDGFLDFSLHCTMRTLYSIFSSQPNEVGHDFTLHNCDIIQHIFSPTRSVARKTLLWTFLWPSNSKFVIFPELYPCINYRILAFYAPIPVQIHGNSIIPPYHIQGNFEYRGILLYKQHIVQCTRCQTVFYILGERDRMTHARVTAQALNLFWKHTPYLCRLLLKSTDKRTIIFNGNSNALDPIRKYRLICNYVSDTPTVHFI